ncbi:uncharacterized protein G2W53_040976 [Senna tora]|uniref:Uncharacterized protein n=1 Tax=Senna tora TaxID=362788 RepID=A0A834SD24_9FABA|nr:uncharacterized protein G2W53_040976 [Senna tora]
MELKRHHVEVMRQFTQLSNEVSPQRAKNGETMPSNTVINLKAVNTKSISSKEELLEPKTREEALEKAEIAPVPEELPKKKTKRPTSPRNDIDEFLNSDVPKFKCLCTVNVICPSYKEFDDFLDLQGAHDPLPLTYLYAGKLTLVGIEGNDGSDRGTLIEQVVVGTDDARLLAMTPIPSPLGSPSLMTEHYVHDIEQGKYKGKEEQNCNSPMIQHPKNPRARGKQKGEKSQSFKILQKAQRKIRVKLKRKKRRIPLTWWDYRYNSASALYHCCSALAVSKCRVAIPVSIGGDLGATNPTFSFLLVCVLGNGSGSRPEINGSQPLYHKPYIMCLCLEVEQGCD